MFQRFFESHGGKFQRFFDFHGGKILGVKKSYGCKKKFRPPKAAENFGLFFGAKSRFQWHFFFDLSKIKIFDISEFHGCKIWTIFKSGGRKFQRKLKSHGRKIWGIFFGNFVEEGNKKNKKKTDA